MKTVLIVGASSQIGKRIAEEFNYNSYAVALTYNTNTITDDYVAELNKIGNCTAYKCDVTNSVSVQNAVNQIIAKYRKIDCLVYCAGVALVQTLTQTTEEQFDNIIAVNQKGAFLFCRAVAPYMISRQSGNVILISSVASQGISCESIYSMSKGALNSFSLALAKELSLSGIRVNTVSPGLIDTKMNNNLTDEEKQILIDSSLIKRIGTPNDVAKAVFFIAESTYITATDITVDGGLPL